MNCIDEELLQKYINHECTDKEKADVEQHLSTCEACAHQLVTREKLYAEIKMAINSLNREKIEVPAFSNVNARLINRNIHLLIYSLSAACILLFGLFIVDNEYQPYRNEITIVQSIPLEVDANRPASEQEFVIEVYDGKSQRTEYYIE
jgi:hypothetical protein